jgi:hypothetical protein
MTVTQQKVYDSLTNNLSALELVLDSKDVDPSVRIAAADTIIRTVNLLLALNP